MRFDADGPTIKMIRAGAGQKMTGSGSVLHLN